MTSPFDTYARTDIKDSKFYINIENELGLSYKKQRAALLAVALSKPANYYNLRSQLIDKITTNQVKDMYAIFWNLLKNGIVGDRVVEYHNENNAKKYLKPDLPEHLINKFASRVSATLEEICEEAVNLILPEDFLKMAQEKQKNILGARGEI
jgi:hypothetical protein